jgi:hypothetical protein
MGNLKKGMVLETTGINLVLLIKGIEITTMHYFSKLWVNQCIKQYSMRENLKMGDNLSSSHVFSAFNNMYSIIP